MEIIKKLELKNKDIYNAKPVTIAFLGDSITQGCFECYFDDSGVQTVFDAKSAYPTRVKEILNLLYPSAQINIINGGISGDNAINGNKRFERDVAPYSPDLVIVSFGLNDACGGEGKLNEYKNALRSIFNKVREIGAECIFVFQNVMNTKVSPHLKDEREKNLAGFFAGVQNNGTVDLYYEAAKEEAKKDGVKFCDIYSAWKKMQNGGIDTTELLANRYNHPEREFHYYIAIKIIEKTFD